MAVSDTILSNEMGWEASKLEHWLEERPIHRTYFGGWGMSLSTLWSMNYSEEVIYDWGERRMEQGPKSHKDGSDKDYS